jgi:hypothetical protein
MIVLARGNHMGEAISSSSIQARPRGLTTHSTVSLAFGEVASLESSEALEALVLSLGTCRPWMGGLLSFTSRNLNHSFSPTHSLYCFYFIYIARLMGGRTLTDMYISIRKNVQLQIAEAGMPVQYDTV